MDEYMAWLPSKKTIQSIKNSVVDAANKVGDSVSSFDIKETAQSASSSAADMAIKAKQASISAYVAASDSIKKIDYEELQRADYYKDTFTKYKDLSYEKINSSFRSTFEVDKTTAEMVDGIRKNMPIPAKSIDDIFLQCKQEAIKRVVASFYLGGVGRDLDDHSAMKYENLSESYQEFSERVGKHALFDDPNFASMKNARENARNTWTSEGYAKLDNGYFSDSPLDAWNADVEHVKSRKAYYDDILLRAGTTDNEFIKVINSKDNLVFADSSLNRSLQDKDIYVYLKENGVPRSDDPDLIDVTIKSSGSVVTVRKSDIDEAVTRSENNRNEHRWDAAVEIGSTMAKSASLMAAQQIVGLIIVETIDIFIDEIREITKSGKIINESGWLQNTKEATLRIQRRLNERFEERNIWAKARSVGLEAGVAGALSVIPQILISLLIKMPAFVLSMVRECTLSIVRCTRIMLSKDEDKLDAITVVLAGTASAVVSVYVGQVISGTIIGVPLLNKFNSQITSVLTGVVVTAVPLTAIYTFDQNKDKLRFVVSQFNKGG
ncbi:hypothetical protein UXA55_02825 [Aeromonas caviae]|uniref:hypothetical protein n=1 Tax=Aeromonas caviae TaxID=648 RepID=UPI002AB50C7A|nr:hypothetical protein [Aeromonas caviae]MDY7828517.1 hypothetical protein [Aeromonas caviae]